MLLPSKLIFKEAFADQLQLNLLILRQFANVLPAAISVFLCTWLATRFKKFWPSLAVFLVLMTVREMFHISETFWHPDAINLLFVVLTFYYLDRDQLKFGPNFYFAAITCGLSTATRLFGAFFFLAIAWLLVWGWIKKVLNFRKVLLAGSLFILLMVGTILVANPYTFSPGELGAAQNTFARRQAVMANGINEPDPENIYRTGLDAWWPFMTRSFGSSATLITLGISVVIGALGKKHANFYRILLAWLLAIGTYLIGFVLVKSSWYMLPFLVPLYCAAMALPENIEVWVENRNMKPASGKILKYGSYALIMGVLAYQLFSNIQIIIQTIQYG